MPNPHFRVEVYSRSGGRSVVAAAAYRSGEVLTASPSVVGLAAYRSGEYLGDKETGETFDYSRKEGVEWSHIYTPDRAPEWAANREQLWNRAELAEIRKDARLARGIEASLPRGLGLAQWQEMCGEISAHFTRHGLVVDAAIHNVKARDGGDNPHVHLLIADRPVDENGFRASKTNVRFLNSELALKGWREAWETITNRHLEAAGLEERVSLKSYKERGIDKTPTKPLGPKASALEKQGIRTPEGDENRRITAENALRELHRQHQESDEGTATPDAGEVREPRTEAEYGEAAIAAEARRGKDEALAASFDRHDLAEADPVRNARGEADYADAGIVFDKERHAAEKAAEREALQAASAEAREAAALAALHQRGREQLRRERSPLWADFGARLSAGADAARGAVHRYRLRESLDDTEDTTRPRLALVRVASAKIGARLREQWDKWKGTTMSEEPRRSWRERIEGPGQTPAAPAGGDVRGSEMASRLSAAARTAALQIGRDLLDSGVRNPQEVAAIDGAQLARPLTPTAQQANVTQRYEGRTLDGTDSPRQGPGTPPAGISRGGSPRAAGQAPGAPAPRLDMASTPPTDTRGADMAGRLTAAGQASAQAAANTILQQNQVTIQAKPQEKDTAAGAPSESIFDKYGGKQNEADKNLDRAKQQTQEHER